MPGILMPQVFEGGSSLLIIEVIDIVEAFCRAFLKVRCFQALREKCIRLGPEYSCKNNYADGKSIPCHARIGARLLPDSGRRYRANPAPFVCPEENPVATRIRTD